MEGRRLLTVARRCRPPQRSGENGRAIGVLDPGYCTVLILLVWRISFYRFQKKGRYTDSVRRRGDVLIVEALPGNILHKQQEADRSSICCDAAQRQRIAQRRR